MERDLSSPGDGKTRIAIDAGHGGKDPGAISRRFGIKEKDITLAVALYIEDYIKKDGFFYTMLHKEQADADIFVFLMADAVTCALSDQSTSQGYYNIERMLRAAINKGAQVKACGTCTEARGLKGLALIEGVEVSSMSQLAAWTVEVDKIITF